MKYTIELTEVQLRIIKCALSTRRNKVIKAIKELESGNTIPKGFDTKERAISRFKMELKGISDLQAKFMKEG